MNQADYIQQSERTEKKFPEGMTLSSDHQVILNFLTGDLFTINEAVDHMKRHLIYGANLELGAPQSDLKLRDKTLTSQQAELLHAALGKVTESVEFLEMIIAHVLTNKELDVANAIEEVGDGMWYDAIVFRLLGSDFEKAGQINIDKLKARFPDKFTSEDALNRDLDTERGILEEGVKGDEITTMPLGESLVGSDYDGSTA